MTRTIATTAAIMMLAGCTTAEQSSDTDTSASNARFQLPTAGQTIRVIHPRNDSAFGERIALQANGTAYIRRDSGSRTGSWSSVKCGSQDCVTISSRISGTTLRYELYGSGQLRATPSSGPRWRWRPV